MGMTTDTTGGMGNATVTTDVNNTQTISADTFKSMISVLEAMINHSHSYTDDWTSNCNCNCTCQCTRGSI